ncbi:hypothetical protein JHK84_041016 [Glycine max]|nr:hypothetical protein JHK84_041016 [Glycine max]
MVALMAPTAGAFFLLLNKTHLALYVSTAIIGVCTGAITSISVSTTTELFGTKNFSVNHNVVVANIPVGSLLFGYLAAFVYHKGGHHEHGKCLGMECYRSTFVIWEMVFQQESHLYVQKKRWFIAQICARLNQINEYDANMMIAMSHPYLNYAVILNSTRIRPLQRPHTTLETWMIEMCHQCLDRQKPNQEQIEKEKWRERIPSPE